MNCVAVSLKKKFMSESTLSFSCLSSQQLCVRVPVPTGPVVNKYADTVKQLEQNHFCFFIRAFFQNEKWLNISLHGPFKVSEGAKKKWKMSLHENRIIKNNIYKGKLNKDS